MNINTVKSSVCVYVCVIFMCVCVCVLCGKCPCVCDGHSDDDLHLIQTEDLSRVFVSDHSAVTLQHSHTLIV